MKRKFVKISSDGRDLWAIADDGTAWWKYGHSQNWQLVEPLPDREMTVVEKTFLTADEERDR
jgi:hypothetical protein